MWLIVFLIVLTVLYIYLNLSDTYEYWKKKKIVYLNPRMFFGNMAPLFLGQQSFYENLENMYAAYPDERYVGIYQYMQPILLVRDPELIKEITVKEFDSFPNHDVYSSKESDPIATKNIFNLSTENGWRDMRATLSPSFTGSKMRAMFVLMEKSADQFVDHFQNMGDLVTVEMKVAFQKYTNDVVAATAFGIESNSFQNPSNEFYKMSKDLTENDGFRNMKMFASLVCPFFTKLFKISIFNQKACEFFKNIIQDSIRIRKEKLIIRQDMIHLLMEASKGGLKDNDQNNNIKFKQVGLETDVLITSRKQKNVNMTIDDITAQTLAFTFAGFETSSTLMSYAAYELALNYTIQSRLREEVDATLKNCDGKLTYEEMAGMRYLDKIIKETLRKWPPQPNLDRRSKIPFIVEAERPREELLYLESGTVCWIPVSAIHKDPKYYPNPTKFDPERFSDENKHNINPYTFLPFGSGPRNCMGSRFAILETKLIIFRIIQKFEIVPVSKTPREIKLCKKSISLTPKEGLWIGLRKRAISSI